MSRLQTGGYAPLFDRLGTVNDEKSIYSSRLNIQQLQFSVFSELNRISQTRSHLDIKEFLNKEPLTVLDYGLPDFFGYSIQNSSERESVKKVLIKAFLCFEPRLQTPVIDFDLNQMEKYILNFHVSGKVIFGITLEPVTFLISYAGNETSLRKKEKLVV
jgi:type VI secretion system lysozyme-like protein